MLNSPDDNFFSDSGLRLGDVLRQAEKRLTAAGIENAMLDARLLAEDALGFDRTRIFANADYELCLGEADCFQKMIARRLAHESVARITGEREFWSLSFLLNEATLEPRPDSETLVEVALSAINARDPRESGDPVPAAPAADMTHTARGCSPLDSRLRGNDDVKILDLGTGTGCLLLALLHELPHASGLGIDVAPRAVEQAQKNAERLDLATRAAFRVNNWLENIAERFDLIVCNPPYIAHGDIAGLMPEVRDHDPRAALDGGADGLDIYRLLIPQLPNVLKPGGIAIFEAGAGQAGHIADLFKAAKFARIETHKDLGGMERCVAANLQL